MSERPRVPDDARARAPLARSWRPWVPLVIVLGLALAVGSFGSRPPASNQDRLFAIAASMQCPICNGETVAESNAAVSQNIRVEIDRRIQAGETDEQIYAYLETKYQGYFVTPSSSGVAGLVWVVPVVALVLSLAGLAWAFRRWSEPAEHHASEEDRELVRRALASEVAGGAGGAGGAGDEPAGAGRDHGHVGVAAEADDGAQEPAGPPERATEATGSAGSVGSVGEAP